MPGQAKKTWLSWSSGKDSAWTLYRLLRDDSVQVTGLFTSVNSASDRVAMHAVRRTLVEAQARAAGRPLLIVPLPWPCSNALYESAMRSVWEQARREGVEQVAFGDLFLEEIRQYRIQQLRDTGLTPVFPLWGEPTNELAHEMITGGLQATLTCVDPQQLPGNWVGRRFDASLLTSLPSGIDPCGENGEFHTFAHAGPMFHEPIHFTAGECVERDGFLFADLLS